MVSVINVLMKFCRCTVCHEYDLCEACFSTGMTSLSHSSDHPMTKLEPNNARILFSDLMNTSGEAAPDQETYICPFCDLEGLESVSLLRHLATEHVGDSGVVVCNL